MVALAGQANIFRPRELNDVGVVRFRFNFYFYIHIRYLTRRNICRKKVLLFLASQRQFCVPFLLNRLRRSHARPLRHAHRRPLLWMRPAKRTKHSRCDLLPRLDRVAGRSSLVTPWRQLLRDESSDQSEEISATLMRSVICLTGWDRPPIAGASSR